MITFHSPLHESHAPAHEYFRGELVPCFEKPARAQYVLDELKARGHEIREPSVDSRPVLAQVHSRRYLAFLESAWSQWTALQACNVDVQPFPLGHADETGEGEGEGYNLNLPLPGGPT